MFGFYVNICWYWGLGYPQFICHQQNVNIVQRKEIEEVQRGLETKNDVGKFIILQFSMVLCLPYPGMLKMLWKIRNSHGGQNLEDKNKRIALGESRLGVGI